ncbi:MAG TPA: hypothetical protein VNZ45_01135 [Bacteroidia bacterium]|nr:hypothetical protein [Bacteroidia bacterium]
MEKPKKYARMAAGSLYYVDKDLGVNRECSVARRVEILAGPTGGNYRVKFGDGSEAIVWKIYLDNFTEE